MNYVLTMILIISVLIVGKLDGDAFAYCEEQTKISRDYCLQLHGIN